MLINCETRLWFAKCNLLLPIVPCGCAVLLLVAGGLADVPIIIPGPRMLFWASMLLPLSGVFWLLSANTSLVKSLSAIAFIVQLAAVVIGVAGVVLTFLGVTIYPERNSIEMNPTCLCFSVVPAIAFVFSGVQLCF